MVVSLFFSSGVTSGTPFFFFPIPQSNQRRPMASSLAFNPPLAVKSVTLLRPVTTCRVITRNTTSLECNIKLDENGGYTSDVSDAFNKDLCPRLPATSNLAHLLNSMDHRIQFRSVRSRCPKWDVFEDAEYLYIVRDLSELPKKFIDYESHHIAPARNVYPANVSGNVFGCLRVHCMVQAIEVTVGRDGPDPGISINGVYYQGYSCRIDLPPTLYKALYVHMDVNNEVLKITIPKKEGKWSQNFNLRLVYHTFSGCWQRKLSSIDHYY